MRTLSRTVVALGGLRAVAQAGVISGVVGAVFALSGCPSSSTPTPAPTPHGEAVNKDEPMSKNAPDFSVQDDAGNTVTLAQHRGKQAVLLAFYPKDFTGG